MAKAGLYIVRSKRLTIDNQFDDHKRAALLETAKRLQIKARAEASMPYGLGSGEKTGKLHRAIQIKGPYGTPRSMVVQVWVDTDIAPHALWQEKGTGIYGPSGEVIRPKQAQVMAWIQTGQPYVGVAVSAFIRKRAARGNAPQYQQYAKWVKGVKPKHFMEKARKDQGIAAFHRNTMRNVFEHMLTGTFQR